MSKLERRLVLDQLGYRLEGLRVFCADELQRVFPGIGKEIELELVNDEVKDVRDGWLSLDPHPERRWWLVECGDGVSRDTHGGLQRLLKEVSPEGSTVYMRIWILE